MYEDRKSALLGELDRVDTVALTTDTWTSNATKSYLTITEHHIDSDWNLMTNVLVTREMPERHTGENIAENLKKYKAEFNLNGKVSDVIHDNARIMTSAGNKCPDWSDHGCFAHTLQLCQTCIRNTDSCQVDFPRQ